MITWIKGQKNLRKLTSAEIFRRQRHLMKRVLVLCVCLLTACETAYYGINEQFGRLKNDILADRVEDAIDAQEDAKEEFKSAFEQFEAFIGVPNTEFKSAYLKLSDAFDGAESRAEGVADRIDAVEDVSEDLYPGAGLRVEETQQLFLR
ncbi:MAG: DUF2959 family protein [Gammaproteobacteria bacterium]|nr:DUF2959 family protein [Gammaproteobacteria bacterium]